MTANAALLGGRWSRRDFLRSLGMGATALAASGMPRQAGQAAERGERPARRNIVLVLSDDHRYDFMGFVTAAPAFLETPHLDRMAREGAHLANAFVSTSVV